jgi:glycosyltransferase involved in cell wall biosynthesis
MAVHQLIPTFARGDATGQSAVHLQTLLRRLGLYGELYAGEVPRELTSLVKPVSALRPAADDLVLYHHGIASPMSGRLMHLPCRRGLVFHNITPARLYEGTPLHEALVSGRAQLAAMAPSVDLAIGVSELNCRELHAAGYRNVHTVPLFVEPERFQEDQADRALLSRLRGPGIAVVSVSRVMPHKRFEDLLALHEELLRIDDQARLILVGGFDPGGGYFRALSRKARKLPGVRFLGRVSHAELVAAYRTASVFVSMSEHEGFGVPLLEAMAAELPVLAYAAAAVPETLGGAGIAFTEKRFATLAELVRALAQDPALRRRVLNGQARRLKELSAAAAQERLAEALGSLEPRGTPRPRPRRPAGRKARPRIAFLVQRYGEVSGGSELLARQVAHHLAPHWDITVLTTCARDHLTWANELPPGRERDGKVEVLRFPTTHPRRMRPFNALSRQVLGRPQDLVTEEHWVAEQGPACPDLFRHLAEESSRYDGFVAFTYLYATTAWGLPMVADRALLVSTAHDEDPIRLGLYREVFRRPRGLICLTSEEAAFIDRQFPEHAPIRIASVGIDLHAARPARFRERHGVHGPYLFYVGRVEAGKGIGELLEHHAALVREFHDAPELVLAGTASMEVKGPRVRYLGRISDEDKYDALAGALAVVIPSRYESLSLLALEAFAQKAPVLVNGRSEVLVGQVQRSGAGVAYQDARSFAEGVRWLGDRRDELGKKGLAFARRHTWTRVVATYRGEMKRILEAKR